MIALLSKLIPHKYAHIQKIKFSFKIEYIHKYSKNETISFSDMDSAITLLDSPLLAVGKSQECMTIQKDELPPDEKLDLSPLREQNPEIHPKKTKKGSRKEHRFVFANATSSYYPIVREAMTEFGYKLTESDKKATLFWVNHNGSAEFASSLYPWQFYNHFPGTWVLARKVELSKSIEMLSSVLPVYNTFYPKSYILPLQYSDLKTYMNSQKEKATFIVKPDRGSLGKGIILVQDPEDLKDYSDVAVAQNYIRPYLVDGLKFDLRVYVLVTSMDPLRIYVYKEGIARFCTEPYCEPDASNLGSAFAHLTNYSLNKKNESFNGDEEVGHKRLMSHVLGSKFDTVFQKVDELVRLTIASVQQFVACQVRATCGRHDDGRSRCFELMGFDILLDSNEQPWLLEVNVKPSMGGNGDLDHNLKMQLLKDTFSVLGFAPADRRALSSMERTKTLKRIVGGAPEPVKQYDASAERERALKTGWRPIYPLDESTTSQVEEAIAASKRFPIGGAAGTTSTRILKAANDSKIAATSPPVERRHRLSLPPPITTPKQGMIKKPQVSSPKRQALKPLKSPQNSDAKPPEVSQSMIVQDLENKKEEIEATASEGTFTSKMMNENRLKIAECGAKASGGTVRRQNDLPFFVHYRGLPANRINEVEERERLKRIEATNLEGNSSAVAAAVRSIFGYSDLSRRTTQPQKLHVRQSMKYRNSDVY